MSACAGLRLYPEEAEAIRRYLADARDALAQLKFLVQLPPEEVARDKTLKYSLRYAVILLVEAAMDVAVTLLEKLFNESPQSYRGTFIKLVEVGIVPFQVGEEMARLAAPRERHNPPLLDY